MIETERRHKTFIEKWSRPLEFVIIIITILSSIVMGSRNLVTKEELTASEESSNLRLEKSQEAQEKYLQEFIINAANSAADRAAEKTINRWVALTDRKFKTRRTNDESPE